MPVKIVHTYDCNSGNKVSEKGICDCNNFFTWYEILIGVIIGLVIWWIQAL